MGLSISGEADWLWVRMSMLLLLRKVFLEVHLLSAHFDSSVCFCDICFDQDDVLHGMVHGFWICWRVALCSLSFWSRRNVSAMSGCSCLSTRWCSGMIAVLGTGFERGPLSRVGAEGTSAL